MGAWGSGLYANDSTCDVRDTYTKFLRDGLDNAAAYEKTLEACREYLEDDEEPLFWFALADTQWRLGRLLPEVKAKALEWIEKDGGLDLWEESANKGAGWKKTLQTLKNRLESPAPPEKKFGKRRIIDMNLWNLYDIYAYRLNGELATENRMQGKYMLMQKVGEDKVWLPSGDQPTMRLIVFDRIFDDLPELDNLELDSTRILPMDYCPPYSRRLSMNVLGYVLRKANYPKDNLIFVGNKKLLHDLGALTYPEKDMEWGDVEGWLIRHYLYWRDKTYCKNDENYFVRRD